MKQAKKKKKSAKPHLIYVRNLKAKDLTMLDEVSQETRKNSNAYNVMFAAHAYKESKSTILKLEKELEKKTKEIEGWEKRLVAAVSESVNVLDEMKVMADRILKVHKRRDTFIKRSKVDIKKAEQSSYRFMNDDDDDDEQY